MFGKRDGAEVRGELVTPARYPRSAGYAPEWMLATAMGPNVLWLAESLCEVMELRPGMRVLDLGCGMAASSIFLAREFGVTVFATDLWIRPSENWKRVVEAGEEARVVPVYAEAHALPYAHGFFDAMVSLDAYHYFGTDDLYLAYAARFVRPGGQMGIVVPGVRSELTEGVPEHLRPYWEAEFSSFHSPAWWRRHWEESGAVTVEVADLAPGGWESWLAWNAFRDEQPAGPRAEQGRRETEMLRVDGGRVLGFTRVVGRVVGR
jgi:cyclopropane fatty-acyl-phospholipid synthase-like methyltransferase